MQRSIWKGFFLALFFAATVNFASAIDTFVDQDIVVPADKISTTATFYDANINGVPFEVLIVKASDGTIRTAFNTCQQCYESGRAYFVQNGSVLVCQNCKQKFRLNNVGEAAGRCNPVPIFASNRRDTDGNIVIPREYLATQGQWQTNWK